MFNFADVQFDKVQLLQKIDPISGFSRISGSFSFFDDSDFTFYSLGLPIGALSSHAIPAKK